MPLLAGIGLLLSRRVDVRGQRRLSALAAAAQLGVALALWAVGVPSPLLWGALATLLNYVVYVGPAVMVVILAQVDPGFAKVAGSAPLWIGVAIFVAGTATAAFAPWRRLATAALIVVLLYSLWGAAKSASALAAALAVGGWAPALGAG